MADYSPAGIQKQKNERADYLKQQVARGGYGKASLLGARLASQSMDPSAALGSGIDDYIQRNPNKVASNIRTGPFGIQNEDAVRNAMKRNMLGGAIKLGQ